jgi:hypothetical protein
VSIHSVFGLGLTASVFITIRWNGICAFERTEVSTGARREE